MKCDQKRVAIVHFTAAPSLGGIEQMIEAQSAEIRRRRDQVVVVAGSGRPGVKCIPRLRPDHPDVVSALHELGGTSADMSHPLVQHLADELSAILYWCTECWVHNALTVSLNPFLTLALCRLIYEKASLRWIAWAEDISATSRYAGGVNIDLLSSARRVRDRVHWVTISHTRRIELAELIGIPNGSIDVITPPLQLCDWLVLNPQTTLIANELRLLESQPVVLIPAKALPHKGLQRSLDVAAALAKRFTDPRILVTAPPSPHQPEESERVLSALTSRIAELGLQSVVCLLSDWLGNAPEHGVLRDLMLLSDVVLLPSAEEGFGMPLFEAACLRVPVVCTDIPVFREVAGDAAAYFPADASAELIVDLIAEAAGGAANRFRREANLSAQRFAAAMRKLLDAD